MFEDIKKFFWIIVVVLLIGSGVIIFKFYQKKSETNHSWNDERENSQNLKENNFQKQLETILTKISEPHTTLWEVQKNYQKSEDILLKVAELEKEKEIVNESKIIKLLGEIRAKFLFKLAEFCFLLEGDEIQLGNLSNSQLIHLEKCIQIGAKESKELFDNATYDDRDYQKVKTTLDNCLKKVKGEIKKRSI